MNGNKVITLLKNGMLWNMGLIGMVLVFMGGAAIGKDNQPKVKVPIEPENRPAVQQKIEVEELPSDESTIEGEALFPTKFQTEVKQQSGAWPQTKTVNEFLQEETRAALLRLRQQARPMMATGNALLTEATEKSGNDRIELTAIYGVGKQLNVEVLINDQRRFYHAGNKWPENVHDDCEHAYALRSIKGRCVTLESKAETRFICLSTEG